MGRRFEQGLVSLRLWKSGDPREMGFSVGVSDHPMSLPENCPEGTVKVLSIPGKLYAVLELLAEEKKNPR